MRALPRAEVERKHAAVRAARGRVQYALEAGTPGGDGVDVIVSKVAAHFARLRASHDRPRMHTGDGTCRTIVGRVCAQLGIVGRTLGEIE